MISIKSILVINFLFLALIPLSSADMWQFVPTKEFGEDIFVQGVEHYGNSEIVKISKFNGNRKSKLLLFDGINIQIFSNDYIENNLESGFTKMVNIEGNVYIVSGRNNIFNYTKSKDWDYIQFKDKYNSQDNKFIRNFTQIAHNAEKLYFLSSAADISSIDTTGGTIRTFFSDKYNEIFSYDGFNLNREIFINTKEIGNFYDISADKERLWIIGKNGLFYLKNGKLENQVNLISKLDLDQNSIFPKIFVDNDFVYIYKPYTPLASNPTNQEPLVIRFDKKTGELSEIKFADGDRIPGTLTEIASYNNRLFFATNTGLFQYYDNKLTYVDIFSQFLDEIPKSFYNYLGTSDIHIEGDKFYIATNVGLIYTDAFTDVNYSVFKNNSNLKLYPNIINESSKELTLESNLDMNVKSIDLYNMSGEVVSQITNPTNIKKGINSLKLDYSISGKYFLTIKTMKDNFIVPLIIKK